MIPVRARSVFIEPLEARIAPAAFVVTSFADSGPGTLRQAILSANATPDADEISFRSAGTIKLLSDLPAITEDLTISTGLAVVINGNRHQIFDITGPDTDVTIRGLRLTGALGEFGAAIHLNSPDGEVLVTRTVLTANRVESTGTAGGGAIGIVAGTLTLESSVVTGNVAAGIGGEAIAQGGGIVNSGNLTIRNSTISANRVTGATAQGGGVAGLVGTVLMENVSVTGNTVLGDAAKGGGIFDLASLTLRGTAVRSNVVQGDEAEGGGLFATGNTTIEAFTPATGRKIVSQFTSNRALGSAGTHGDPGARGTSGSPGLLPGEDGTDGDSGTDGTAATAGGVAQGGAIWNAGALVASEVVISSNVAQGGSGGNGGRGGNGGNGGAGAAGGVDEFGTAIPRGRGGAGGNGGSGGVAGAGGAAAGGGIFNAEAGSVTAQASIMSGNAARAGAHGLPGAAGAGGLGSTAGVAGAAGDRVADLIEVSGGGVHNDGILLIGQSSSVARNVVVGGSVFGGGIANTAGATLNFSDSLIASNVIQAASGLHGRAGAAGASGTRGAVGEDGGDGEAGAAGGAGSDGGAALGAGIFNLGTATVVHSTISGNVLTSGNGGSGGAGGAGGSGGLGGAAFFDRELQETIPAGARGAGGSGGDGGEAGVGGRAAGGGIFSEAAGETSATLVVTNSTISGNIVRAGASGFPGLGGAAGGGNAASPASRGANAVAPNLAEGGGGGVYVSGGSVDISQSTIALNVSSREGGGVKIAGQPTAAQIHNSTIATNVSTLRGGGVFSSVTGAGTLVEVISTIIAMNTSRLTVTPDPDVSGQFDISFSAVGNVGTAVLNGASNLTGIDPRLGVLRLNGDTTATMLPAVTSPVLNAGSNPDARTIDQRGLPRVSGVAIDIGAVEVQVAAPV